MCIQPQNNGKKLWNLEATIKKNVNNYQGSVHMLHMERWHLCYNEHLVNNMKSHL